MADNHTGKRAVAIALACFFFFSGFCSLLYQTVWLRLAFASFGVITPVISVVVSLFMLGLAIGSRFGGKYIGPLTRKTGKSAILFYGITELVTAIGGLAVPAMFGFGENHLLNLGATDSVGYLALSALSIALAILPWAVAMGATFPFAMAFFKEVDTTGNSNSFGFLYMSNVAGAMFGAVIPVLVLIERLGFKGCLYVGVALNLLIAVGAMVLAAKYTTRPIGEAQNIVPSATVPQEERQHQSRGLNNAILFTTGLVSLAVEVCWTRLFTPVLGTVVYSFAWILAIYLASTFFGSWLYRLNLRFNNVKSKSVLLGWTAATAFIPIVINDPRLHLPAADAIALLSIAPFCAALGYLTPMIIDEVSQGDPDVAGTAYGINVVGGIVGPLLTGYLLLPLIGVKLALICLTVPLVILAIFSIRKTLVPSNVVPVAGALGLLVASLFSWTWEERFPFMNVNAEIHHDYAATTVCFIEDQTPQLFVNGIGMTTLCRTTKFMAHIPMAIVHQPAKVLIICFGMGTTYRSMLSWPTSDTTAIELIPGVKSSFDYFWKDGAKVMSDPRGRVIIDDGRRFLKRTGDKFDLITVDPPPPVQAAGSSLLYSKEFYSLVKEHLTPNGIFCGWFPTAWNDDDSISRAVAQSISDSFKYVKVYRSVDQIGYHFFCSDKPIPEIAENDIWSKMPETAKQDMLEFEAGDRVAAQKRISQFCGQEVPITKLFDPKENISITDDRPYNEYFWLRNYKF